MSARRSRKKRRASSPRKSLMPLKVKTLLSTWKLDKLKKRKKKKFSTKFKRAMKMKTNSEQRVQTELLKCVTLIQLC
jgi:GTP-binding protein EngB required for normal cell division